jgi:hypothetical protein
VQNQDRLLEQQTQLDMSQSNILTVQALAQAADAGKANLKANDLENVEGVLDDIADQNSQMAQMQDALAMPTGMMAEMDGDDLDEELAVRCAHHARHAPCVPLWRNTTCTWFETLLVDCA